MFISRGYLSHLVNVVNKQHHLTFGNNRSTFHMKIATYNVNGVNGRLSVLLRWLNETVPDIVCLQELKAPGEKFPEGAIKEAGYNAIWHGQNS